MYIQSEKMFNYYNWYVVYTISKETIYSYKSIKILEKQEKIVITNF